MRSRVQEPGDADRKALDWHGELQIRKENGGEPGRHTLTNYCTFHPDCFARRDSKVRLFSLESSA